MTFKTQLASDLDVFFNSEEFAASGRYNGKDVTVMSDMELLQSTSVPGVLVPSLTVYLRQDEVAVCKPGDKLVMDGKTYYVGSSPMLDGGIWTLQVDLEIGSLYGV